MIVAANLLLHYPHDPHLATLLKSCSATEEKFLHLGKNYLRGFLLDQVWYGVGDNYGAFNGNLGVSSGDVICDVKRCQ